MAVGLRAVGWGVSDPVGNGQWQAAGLGWTGTARWLLQPSLCLLAGSYVRQGLLSASPPSFSVCQLRRCWQTYQTASGGPVLAGGWAQGQGRGGEAEGRTQPRGRQLVGGGDTVPLVTSGALRMLGQCLYPGWMGLPSVRLLVSTFARVIRSF